MDHRDAKGRWVSRPTFWIAAVLAVLAGVGIWAWFHFKGGLRSWTPNIVVGALTTAVTITIIDWAIRRESKRKLRPRVEDALYWIGLSFRGLVSSVAIDYASTHLNSFKPLPDDATELLQQWLDERANEDGLRPEALNESLILEGGIELRQAVERARERDRDVLEPDLIREMDEFTRTVNFATWRASGAFRLPNDDTQVVARELSTGIVDSGIRFAEVFKRYAPTWMAVPDVTREGSRAHSDQLRQLRDAAATD